MEMTEKSLGIIWWTREKQKNGEVLEGHSEVDGVIAYGYWKNNPHKQPLLPKGVWPDNTMINTVRLYDLENNNWTVYMWEIRILEWPHAARWDDVLKRTLTSMINDGAKVAWFALEGNFIEPPLLFNSIEMPANGIYASLTKDFEFKCTAKLGMPYKGFNDEDMHKLRNFVSA